MVSIRALQERKRAISTTGGQATTRDRLVWPIWAVVGVGWLVRVAPLALSGVVRFPIDYDQGVNYSASVAFVHGSRLYADVVFVHPPGLAYLLAPVSWLPPLTGFGLSRILMTIVGAANILVICRIAHRHAGLLPALVAGSLYAFHPAAVAAERGVFLEPVLILLILASASHWLKTDADSSTTASASRSAWLSGVLLGCALVVKLWALLALVACLASCRRGHVRSDSARLVAGTIVACATLLLPVLFRSPMSFVEQVVVFQMKRPPDGTDKIADRLSQILFDSAAIVPALGVLAAVVVLMITRRLTRMARFSVAWFGVTVTSFLVSGSYYPNYNAYLAPSAALLIAVAVGGLQQTLTTRASGQATLRTLIAAATTLSLFILGQVVFGVARTSIEAADATDVAPPQRPGRCFLSFDPGQLISAGTVADPDRVGPIAVDPYGAQLLAVVRTGRRYESARAAFSDPASTRAVEEALARCDAVLLGARGHVQLGDFRGRFEQRFRPDTSAAPELDLWIRREA